MIAGLHTAGESPKREAWEPGLTFSRAQEPKESCPVDTSRTKRSISLFMAFMAKNNLKQSRAVVLSYTVADLSREFPNDDACLEFIKEQRWPGGVTKCEKCNIERKHYRVSGRTAYACTHCGNHIYPLKGTVFARSTTSLKTWFYMMYLMASMGRGLTAKRIQQETGVTYKTAWRTLRHLRPLIVSMQMHPAQSVTDTDVTTGTTIKNCNLLN
jgi:transposase-like protein